MVMNVNCQCVRASDHACMHHAAPKPWFGRPQCLLVYPAADPRQKGCALQYPYTKPDGYPLGPPNVLLREGSMVELKVPPNTTNEPPAVGLDYRVGLMPWRAR